MLAWDRIYGEFMAESRSWELWDAAYLINAGCGDDGFHYFRGWLLGQGHAIWQAALAAPDSLADHPPRSAVAGRLRDGATRWSATTCCVHRL